MAMVFNDMQGREFAKATDLRIWGGEGLGIHRLFVTFNLHLAALQPGQSAVIAECDGDAVVSGRGGQERYLGRLRVVDGPVWIESTEYPRDNQLTLELELDRPRLEAVEGIRLGGDLSFTFRLRLRREWQQVEPPKSAVQVHDERLTYRANQSTWIEALQAMGYAKVLLLELPVPEKERRPELAEAVDHLSQAQQSIDRGHYREAVGHCRDTLEAATLALGDKPDLSDQALKRLFDDSRAMDKVQRLQVVRRAMALLCHPARHVDEVTTRIDWDREDAVSVVSMAGALLRMR